MKYVLFLFLALCFLFSCKSGPVAVPDELPPASAAEIPAVPLDGEAVEPPGPETAEEDEAPLVSQGPEAPPEAEEPEEPPEAEEAFAEGSGAVLLEEDVPEITLPEPVPQALASESSDEFAALPEPVFPEPAVSADPAIALLPEPESEPEPQTPEPALDIYPEPGPELALTPPPAAEPEPANPPVSPPVPVPVPEPEPVQPPASTEPPAGPRPAEPAPPAAVSREPLPLPSALPLPLPVTPPAALPAREPPSPLPAEGDLEYSRLVRAVVGQTVEIPFRENGWVYLGELHSRPGVAYNSRRSDSEGQTFVFRAQETGTFGLKFYKQDYIRDYILNDYVQVIVDEAPEREMFAPIDEPGRVITASRWPALPEEEPPAAENTGVPDNRIEEPAAVQPAEIAAVPQTPDAVQTPESAVPQTPAAAQAPESAAPQTPATTGRRPPPLANGWDDDSIVPVVPPRAASPGPVRPDTPPEEYFRQAREAFEAGQVPEALEVLDRFREWYPLGSDEAWWLYGQFLEAAGPGRNIRLALDYYRRLVREYPQSARYEEARRRIAYLERYYFNIQ
jgi:TolA-binding protein